MDLITPDNGFSIIVIIALIISAILIFLASRFIIKKISPTIQSKTITIASLIIALVLSPLFAYAIIILALIVWGFHG